MRSTLISFVGLALSPIQATALAQDRGSNAPVINSGAPPPVINSGAPPAVIDSGAPPPPSVLPSTSVNGSALLRPSFPNVEMKVEPKPGLENECPFLVQLFDFATPTVVSLPYFGAPKPASTSTENETQLHIEGDAPLQWISQGGFSLASRDKNTVTWLARLSNTYNRCEGKAWLYKRDGVARTKDQSYIALEFGSGQVSLTLDLQKKRHESRLEWAGIQGGGRPAWRYVSAAPTSPERRPASGNSNQRH